MKWKVRFVDGGPSEEVRADTWNQVDMWVHFYRGHKYDENLVAAFRADYLKSIELVE